MFVMFFMFLDKSCTEERAQCPRRRQVARLFPPVSSVHHIATDAWQLILPFHSIPFMSFQSIFCEFLPGFFRLQKKTCHFHALTSLLVSLLTAKEVMHRGALSVVLQGSRRPGCFMCFRQILIVISTSWICRPMCHISTFLGSKDLKILKMLAMNDLPDAQHASHPLLSWKKTRDLNGQVKLWTSLREQRFWCPRASVIS
jgi:hypothetical protein